MEIRPAGPDDVPALLPLFRAYCDFYESDPSDEGLERMIAGAIALPDDQAFVLVAADGERIVGFAACCWKWSSLRGARIVHLDDLFVEPDMRGRGLADRLIAEVAAVARRGGAPVVTWLTAPDNHRAQTVYNRVGGTSEPFLEYELEL